MKIRLFHNDTSTKKDEIILAFIDLFVVALGAALIYFHPALLFFSRECIMFMGAIFMIIGIQYIPVLIFRFSTNDYD